MSGCEFAIVERFGCGSSARGVRGHFTVQVPENGNERNTTTPETWEQQGRMEMRREPAKTCAVRYNLTRRDGF